MKPIYIVILLLVFLMLTGCSDKPDTISTDLPEISEEASPLIFEQEYHEIGEKLIGGSWIGGSPSEFGIPEDNIFVTDSELVSYDYVSVFGTEGNIAFYLRDEKVSKCVFGSNPYDERTIYTEALNLVNKFVAEAFGQEAKELIFTGYDDTEDEWDLFYNGAGSFTADYEENGFTVSVRGSGVNSMATIVVECHPSDREG